MAENEEILDMSLFNEQDLELNLDLPVMDFPTGETEEPVPAPPGEGADEEAIVVPDEDDTLSEGETPEVVAEEEGAEEEGGDQENSPNLYSSFATVLSEQGLLPSLDLQENSIESLDSLTTALKSEIANQSKDFIIEKLGQDGYDALERGITVSEIQQFNETANRYESIDEDVLHDDIELAKKIILQDYVNQGMTEVRALRILNKSVDAGDEVVIEDAIDSLESLKAFEQAQLAKVAESREAEQREFVAEQERIDNDLKNTIYKGDELIKGHKVTKAMQDKVYNSITHIVGQDTNGVAENKLMRTRRENPIDFDTKLYYLFELTNGFEDFSRLAAKSTTKATSQLERALRSNKFEEGGDPAFTDKGEDYGGVGSELVL